jgi:hypothetical protein
MRTIEALVPALGLKAVLFHPADGRAFIQWMQKMLRKRMLVLWNLAM